MSEFFSEIMKPQGNWIIYSNAERKRLQNENFISSKTNFQNPKEKVRQSQINKN